MILNLAILGERLQMLRKALSISQKDMAALLNVKQVQISRVESGDGGSLELFVDLINFYAKDFYLNLMFSDHFEPVKRADITPGDNVLKTIATERLKELQKDFTQEITSVITIINSES